MASAQRLFVAEARGHPVTMMEASGNRRQVAARRLVASARQLIVGEAREEAPCSEAREASHKTNNGRAGVGFASCRDGAPGKRGVHATAADCTVEGNDDGTLAGLLMRVTS